MNPPSPGCVVGARPWFPWPLSRLGWLNDPVPAERLAAIRVVLGAMLLLDILTTYLPDARVWFGDDSMGTPEMASWVFNRDNGRGSWSILQDVHDVNAIRTVLVVWAIATAFLVLGFCTRLSALVSWVIALSVGNINTNIDNSGDLIRTTALFYLMLGRSGAAWSVDSWLGRHYKLVLDWPFGWCFERRPLPLTEPTYIYPWVLRLITIQMAWVYFANGYYKASGNTWPEGTSLYYVLGDLELTRVSYAQFPIPVWLTRFISKTVLLWELSFPIMYFAPWKTMADALELLQDRVTIALRARESPGRDVAAGVAERLPHWLATAVFLSLLWLLLLRPLVSPEDHVAVQVLLVLAWTSLAVAIYFVPAEYLVSPLRWNREIALAFGFLFHVGIGVQMEIGGFPFYLMALYMQFLPWERLGRKPEPVSAPPPPALPPRSPPPPPLPDGDTHVTPAVEVK